MAQEATNSASKTEAPAEPSPAAEAQAEAQAGTAAEAPETTLLNGEEGNLLDGGEEEPQESEEKQDAETGELGYEIDTPEDFVPDEQLMTAFKGYLKASGADKQTAQALFKMGMRQQEILMERQQEARKEWNAAQVKEIKQAYKADFKGAREDANAGMRIMEKMVPGYIKFVNDAGLGNSKIFFDVAIAVRKALGEDRAVMGKGEADANAPHEAGRSWHHTEYVE